MNTAGLNLIKSFETCRLAAYPDPASGGDPWTIGWGSTGPGIGPGVIWTQAEADDRLHKDLDALCVFVRSHVKTTLTDNQEAAVVSLVYNVGRGNFIGHDLQKYLDLGDFKAASDEFPKWDRASGKVMPGLLRRRLAEQALFNST